MSPIILTRGHAFEMGTFGKWHMPDGFECCICEPPWKGNKIGQSCIPPGVYTLERRNSEVVRRTTGGRYTKGWEVTDVPGRSWVMIHPGNVIEDTEGCLMPGDEFGGWTTPNGYRWAVLHSHKAFDQLMSVLGGADSWTLQIRYMNPEYP